MQRWKWRGKGEAGVGEVLESQLQHRPGLAAGLGALRPSGEKPRREDRVREAGGREGGPAFTGWVLHVPVRAELLAVS
jgi:hypothetical protein